MNKQNSISTKKANNQAVKSDEQTKTNNNLCENLESIDLGAILQDKTDINCDIEKENQEKKQWVSQAMYIEKYINELKQGYKKVQKTLEKQTELQEKNKGYAGEVASRQRKTCLEYLEKIDTLLDEQYAQINRITDVISEIKHSKHRAVMVARYINFKPIFKIAAEQNYSERYVKLLLKEGLEMLDIDKPIK